MARELRYPRYDLDQSLEVARTISGRGSGATLSGHELAALLGYSGTNNGAYLTRMADARLFGFVEGKADAISATDRAERILHPDYPQTADRARLEAFRGVPLYSAFLDGFRGRELPDQQGIVNALLSQFKVPPSEAKSVAARLLNAAEQAGLFRIAGSRTRMIEPTFGAPPIVPGHVEVGETPPSPPPGDRDLPMRHFPKIIDGVLDLMPSAQPWDESEYLEWLAFFDQACRVYYRIPRGFKRPGE